MKKLLLLSLIPMLLLPGCTSESGLTGADPMVKTPVIFSIAVDKANFKADGELTVRVYNAAELKKADDTANCAVSFNAETGEETSSCPDAELAQPQEFRFPVAELETPLKIKPQSLYVGEKYRVQVNGPSTDGCNTTSAQDEALADKAEISLELEYATTERGCIPPDQLPVNTDTSEAEVQEE